MSGPLKFGKFKGNTLQQIYAMGEEGIGYLQWLRDNTQTTGKYAASNKALIAEVNQVLTWNQGVDEIRRVPDSQVRAPQAATASNPSLKELQSIRERLDIVIKLLQKLAGVQPEAVVTESDLQPDEEVPF
jgi:hypothetical protein